MLAKVLPKNDDVYDSNGPTVAPVDPAASLGRVIHDINGRRATLGMELLAAERLLDGLDQHMRERLASIFSNLAAVGEKLGQSVADLRELRAVVGGPARRAAPKLASHRLDEVSTTALLCAATLSTGSADPRRVSACAAELIECVRVLQDIAGEEYEQMSARAATFALADRARRTIMIVLDREDELEEIRRLLSCVLPNTWIIPVSSPMTAIEIVDAPDGPHLDLLVIGGSTPLLLDVVSRARRHQPDLPALVLRSEDAALERGEGCSVLRSSYSPNDLVDEVLSMLMPELSDQGGQDPGTRC